MHVGLHKTGTSTLQKGMRKLAPQLRANRIGILTLPQIKALPAQKAWTAWTKPRRAKAPFFRRQLRKLISDENERVIAASGSSMAQLFFSEERALGVRMPSQIDSDLFRPRAERALTELLDIVDAEESHVVMYVRRQDTFMESAYLWEIQKGLDHSIHEQFPFANRAIIDLAQLSRRIERLDRVDSLLVRPFETIASGSIAFLDHFTEVVGMAGKLDYAVLDSGYSVNRSYSQKGLDIALKINSELDTPKQREAVKRLIKRQFGIDQYSKAVIWDDDERMAIMRLYRDSNEELFLEYMPELPADSYSSIEATARLANVLKNQLAQ